MESEKEPTNPYLESNDVIAINTNPYLEDEEETKKEQEPKVDSPGVEGDEEEYKSVDSGENSAN